MAYLDRTGRKPHPAVLTIVTLLHVGAGYAIVTGLAHKYVKEVMPVFEAKNYRLDEPPPPPPKPKPSATPEVLERQIVAPKPPIDLTPTETQRVIEMPLPPLPPGPVERISIVPPPPPPPPSPFTPRRAMPRGNTSLWATTNDYPARDLREGNQGLTRFSVVVGADGKVESCSIATSSGSPGLDKATCDNVSRRARFEPATDGNGTRVSGTYSGSIRWQIPD